MTGPAEGSGRTAETQPERTALAWQRTGLGVLAVSGLLAHVALSAHRIGLLVPACLVALAGLGVLGGLAPVRYRQVRRAVTAATPASAPRSVAAVSALIGLAAAVALATVVVILLP